MVPRLISSPKLPLLAALFALPLAAQEERPLFRAAQAPAALAKSAAPAFARARHFVEIDWATLAPGGDTPAGAAARLNLGIPGGPALRAEKARVKWDGPRRFTWVGHDGGDETILSARGEALAGVIHSGGKTFEVTPIKGALHQVVEVDMDLLNEEELRRPNDEEEERVEVEPFPQPALAPGQEIVIDVLVLYDASAASAAGDIDAFTASLIEQTNESYVRSKIPQKIRLVHVQKVDFSITSPGQLGSNATATKLRDQYGADLVSIIQGSVGGGCGIGNMSGAFTMVSRSCALSSKSFAHELGHNMGARHNTEEDASAGYAHGWYSKTGNWRTIMSYPISGCTCNRINNFSNPDVMQNGIATGVADQRDNARKMRERSQPTADFRKAVTPTGINLVINKTGMGTVTSDVGGIACGNVCSGNFALGTSTRVVLTAKPDSGWIFKGWSGDCTGTGTCALTVDSDRQAAALFENPNFIRFSLVETALKKPFLDLKDSVRLEMDKLPAGITVEAIPSVKVGSIVFTMSGMQSLRQVQTTSPYTLFSEQSQTGIYNAWNPQLKAGKYSITATGYSGTGGSGDVLGKGTIVLDFKGGATGIRAGRRDSRLAVLQAGSGSLKLHVGAAARLDLSVRTLDGKSFALARGPFAPGLHDLAIPARLAPGLHFLHVRGEGRETALKFTVLR